MKMNLERIDRRIRELSSMEKSTATNFRRLYYLLEERVRIILGRKPGSLEPRDFEVLNLSQGELERLLKLRNIMGHKGKIDSRYYRWFVDVVTPIILELEPQDQVLISSEEFERQIISRLSDELLPHGFTIETKVEEVRGRTKFNLDAVVLVPVKQRKIIVEIKHAIADDSVSRISNLETLVQLLIRLDVNYGAIIIPGSEIHYLTDSMTLPDKHILIIGNGVRNWPLKFKEWVLSDDQFLNSVERRKFTDYWESKKKLT